MTLSTAAKLNFIERVITGPQLNESIFLVLAQIMKTGSIASLPLQVNY